MVDIALIKQLREQTGAGFADVKEALEVSGGNVEGALEELKKKGAKAAAKRADRETTEGLVHAYIHSTGKLGVLLALGCETDFVARNDAFKELANDIALHIAASQPQYVKPDHISAEVVEKKRVEIADALKEEGKPEAMIAQITEGKLAKWYEEVCLLNQKFIKNEDITISQLLEEKIGTIGEKIEVVGFSLQTIG